MKVISAFSRNIWHLFISIRLAIVLILILVGLSLAGAILPQAPMGILKDTTEYSMWLQMVIVPKFGIWTYILSFIGLLDVFHSFIFLGTGYLLIVNILCCTANRWNVLRNVASADSVHRPADFYTTGDSCTEINSVPRQASDSARILQKALSKYHYRVIPQRNRIIFTLRRRSMVILSKSRYSVISA